MNPLQLQLERIRRRRWLVAVVTLAAVLVTTALTLTQHTTWTARAALTTSSQNRSPDQDAFLAQGYAQYFNEPSYQELIAKAAGVPAGITFSARTAATSPILYVEATGPDRDLTIKTVGHLAEVFRDEVGGQIGTTRQDMLNDIDRQIADARTQMASAATTPDQRIIILQQIFSLESQATSIKGDTTNQLKDLQLDAGASASSPHLAINIALGLVGGLILGCVVALAVAALGNRVSTSHDVRELLDLDTLAEIRDDPRTRRRGREQALKGLANVIDAADIGRPAMLAVTAARRTGTAREAAEGIAYYRSTRGESTLLLRTDLHHFAEPVDGAIRRGVAEHLEGTRDGPLDPVELPAGIGHVLVIESGDSEFDPYELFAPERVSALVARTRTLAELVVIEAPAVLDAPEAEVLCAAADATVLVVEAGVTTASDASEACRRLEQMGVSLLGVVISAAPRRDDLVTPFRRPDPVPADPFPADEILAEHLPAEQLPLPTDHGAEASAAQDPAERIPAQASSSSTPDAPAPGTGAGRTSPSDVFDALDVDTVKVPRVGGTTPPVSALNGSPGGVVTDAGGPRDK